MVGDGVRRVLEAHLGDTVACFEDHRPVLLCQREARERRAPRVPALVVAVVDLEVVAGGGVLDREVEALEQRGVLADAGVHHAVTDGSHACAIVGVEPTPLLEQLTGRHVGVARDTGSVERVEVVRA